MSLPGNGFIALWNDIDPLRSDYDTWHTTEHVPERLSVPGFLLAYRYVLTAGALPKYFTLYALADIGTLNTDDYRRLIREPTSWTRGMRRDFRNVGRLVCQTIITHGAGVGGFVAVCVVRSIDRPFVASLCESLVDLDGISATHFGEVDHSAEPLGLDMPQSSFSHGACGILVIEGYGAEALRSHCEALELDRLDPLFEGWSLYKLVYELRKDDLRRLESQNDGAPLTGHQRR